MKMMNKVCALVLSVALCAGMAAPAFAYDGEPVEEVEQPVLTAATEEEEAVTVTDEETGALTPEGNLTLVDDYHTDYSDGSGQQFITLVSKSGATFYLVIDRNAKGQQTVHFMNLVDEADLLSLMEDEDADAYTAEKETAAQAEQERVHRLCTRAGMLESFLVCPGELTDDQVMELLKISFRQPEVVLALAKMVHDVHERSNVQNPLE